MAETTEMFVEFEKFCKDCRYYDKSETEDPCYECLTNPVNYNSRKPLMFKDALSKHDNKGQKDK